MEGEVKRFYHNSVVFVTGGTGFLGKILLQKLLYHTFVKKIFILVRCKKNKSEEQRYADIFEHKIFETLVKEQPDYKNRVELITGDCVLPNLGIRHSDWEKLKNEVNVVFHCAATVRFDQNIKTATHINIRAPMDLLKNAKEFKNLKGFVHVSTAYANCPRNDISEVFYEPGMSPRNLLTLVDVLSDDQLDDLTSTLIGNWPNTYAFTKCICEDLIRTDGAGLPVAVIRPSMVISTYKEPFPGWIDNYYGPIGISCATGYGILRTIRGHLEYHADMVPGDYVINAMIAAAWSVSKKTTSERKNISIYNYVCSPERPITWKYYTECCLDLTVQMPLPTVFYKPMLFFTKHRWVQKIRVFLLHWIPAYTVDFICLCTGQKQLLVDGYKKLHKFVEVVEYFTCREWAFDNRQTQKLWENLGEEDKKLFPFSMKCFNWEEYLPSYILGGRTYLMNTPVETLPDSRRKMKILQLIHRVIVSTFISILLFLLYQCFK